MTNKSVNMNTFCGGTRTGVRLLDLLLFFQSSTSDLLKLVSLFQTFEELRIIG